MSEVDGRDGTDVAERVATAYSFPGLKSSPGVTGAAMPSGRGPCGRRRRRGGKRSPPLPSKPPGAAVDLRLRSGDERRQTVDADIIGDHRLRLGLRLKLRLRAMLAMAVVLAGRMLVARLVGLSIALVVARIVVARHERLLLHRDKAGLLPEIRKALAVVVAVLRGHFILGARLRLVLTELFLGGGDQAEIMLGMLIIILGGDRVAGRAGVARQLHVFFRDVGCGAADLDVRPVGLEHPGHRVLAAPVAIVPVIVVVPVTHPLVLVLTVSHVLPLFQP